MSAPETSPTQTEAIAWFTRMSGSEAARERGAFEAWRKASPEHAAAYDRVASFWADPGFAEVLKPYDKSVPMRRRWHPLHWAAAAALVLLTLGLGAEFDLTNRLRADHYTATGQRQDITLADGSEVTLNSHSALSIDFSDNCRCVSLLDGEGYFEVAPDPAKPFRVQSGEASITVIGTGFSVLRWGDTTRVAVRHGKVTVEQDGRSVTLTANQTIKAGPAGLDTPAPFDPGQDLAWLEGLLIFRDRPLNEVVAEVERYYPGWIEIKGEDLATTRIGGVFRLDDPHKLVDTLAASASAKVTRFTDRLVILSR